MLTLRLLFAAAAVDPTANLNVPPNAGVTNALTGHVRDLLLIVGVAVVLGLTLFLYVYVTRRGRHSHSHTGSRVIYRAEKRKPGEENSGKRKLRKKRRREDEFAHRNPTLGETGGLPPLRTDEPVEPAQ